MRHAILVAAFLAVILLLVPGCQMNERLSGTAMGGVAGAAIGGLAGGWGGAVIGGAGGALAGYLIGDYIADGRERGRSTVFTSEVDPNYQAPQGYGPSATYARTAPPQYRQPAPQQAQPQPTYGYPSMVAGLKVSPAHQAYQRGRNARNAVEARRHYTESLRLDPRQPAVHNALGLHDLLEGNRIGAQQRFRTALRYDPSNYAARQNLKRMGITASR